MFGEDIFSSSRRHSIQPYPKSFHRSISPLGSSRFEQPYILPHSRAHDCSPNSRSTYHPMVSILGGLEPSPSPRGYSAADEPIATAQAHSFYERDPYDRVPPPRPRGPYVGDSSSLFSPRRRQPSLVGSYIPAGVDLSSYGGGPDPGLNAFDRAFERPRESPDRQRDHRPGCMDELDSYGSSRPSRPLRDYDSFTPPVSRGHPGEYPYASSSSSSSCRYRVDSPAKYHSVPAHGGDRYRSGNLGSRRAYR